MKVIAVLVLTSLSLTAAFIKQPASSRATTDLSAMTKKKKEGHAFFNKRNLLESLPVIDAFAKHPVSSRVTKKMEEGQAFFDTVFSLDRSDKESLKFGARAKKNLKTGKIGARSYVPSGLSPAQYKAMRDEERADREKKYKEKSAKAFKFLEFNKFYQKRGTNLDGPWVKDPTKGHRMAKFKYDFSGKKDESKKFESTTNVKEFEKLFSLEKRSTKK